MLQHNLANAVLYEYVYVLHISMVSVLSWTAETELLGEKFKNQTDGASLVAQWLRVRLPMQGTRVRALVREDPTCRGATGLVRHNY